MKPKSLSCALLALAGLAAFKDHGLYSAHGEEDLHQVSKVLPGQRDHEKCTSV